MSKLKTIVIAILMLALMLPAFTTPAYAKNEGIFSEFVNVLIDMNISLISENRELRKQVKQLQNHLRICSFDNTTTVEDKSQPQVKNSPNKQKNDDLPPDHKRRGKVEHDNDSYCLGVCPENN